MYFNFHYESLNHAIPRLFEALGKKGNRVPSRNGDTLELAFTGITLFDSTAREILVPDRKHNLAAQIAETMWILSGRNDIGWLSDYLPRAADYSDDGETWRGGYGKRIRNFGATGPMEGIDQIQHVVGLLKSSPDTRQAVVSIYDPNVDTAPGKDIPCNDFLHFLHRDGSLDLHVFVRSNDMMWGWSGINVFEWSSLLEVVAGLAGMEPGALHFSVSSFHLYEQHWVKAQKIADAGWETPRDVKTSPRFDPEVASSLEEFHNLCHRWFLIEAAIRKQASLPTRQRTIWDLINEFPEPMMQSWLRVIAWWWTSDEFYLIPLNDTALYESARLAVQPLTRLSVVPEPKVLIDEIIDLHNQKDAAYGDSWCRRGEMLGILANIARKVDRLGGAETSDETSLDTAMDLFVYLGKYRAWIDGGERDMANGVLRTVAEMTGSVEYARDYLEAALREQFEALEDAVVHKNLIKREELITRMLENAWSLVVTIAEEQ